MSDLSPVYRPKEVEDKWYRFWEENKSFSSKPDPNKKPYCIVIPPPNITGILHMGHALNNTIQDILIRYKRMQGFETLWMPGTDHAGIATQNVVEKQISTEGLTRKDLGRERFIQRVWQWQREYGSTIIRQLKKLGCSCDWDRTRFTMDDGYTKAVQKVFLHLYEKGLIYKGNYIVNWCPRCQTALSDEEAPYREIEGFLYYIRYPIKDSTDYVTVATTRPETMLGDTAVAINPGDRRYKKLLNKSLILPLVGRGLKIIQDNLVDPEFGTGLVKVTPAHDPNDFQMALRHKLEFVVVMNPDGTMNSNAGEYSGMDRFEARAVIVEDLKSRGLIEKVTKHHHSVGHCYRCHTIIEPYLSKQWFVKMKPLAEPAIKAVKDGRIKFYPSRWTKVYLNWMENIKDWCISRQIWWGHRIPVYYCADERCKPIASIIKPSTCPNCGKKELTQDEDVLDTWFSSWLWPFATFGWPDGGADELRYYYPTSSLVTAQEIIFFWVARMIMAGLEFMNDIPFRDVYIHGTVRDDTGKKMSKSLGNIIDPLEIIEQVGADALRFSIISITSVGQDVFLSKQKFELGRNFANKIWNASRYILSNLKGPINKDLCIYHKSGNLNMVDRWILSRFYQMLKKVNIALDKYRFNEAAGEFYSFFWHEFCDWYIEFSKTNIGQENTQLVLYKVLEKSLRVLHPFMPFITEEIWSRFMDGSIMKQKWPHLQPQIIDKDVESKIGLIIVTIVRVRNIRSIWHIPQASKIELLIKATKPEYRKIIEENTIHIQNLAKVKGISLGENLNKPSRCAVGVADANLEVYVPLESIIDFEKEKSRLNKEIDQLLNLLKKLDARLKDERFLKNAPKEVVEKDKIKKIEIEEKIQRLKSHIEP